jgi:hypothetical protein
MKEVKMFSINKRLHPSFERLNIQQVGRNNRETKTIIFLHFKPLFHQCIAEKHSKKYVSTSGEPGDPLSMPLIISKYFVFCMKT